MYKLLLATVILLLSYFGGQAQSNSLSDGTYYGTITCSASGSGSGMGGSGSGMGRATGDITIEVSNGRVTGDYTILWMLDGSGTGRRGRESQEMKIWEVGTIGGTSSSFYMSRSSANVMGSVTDRSGTDNFNLPVTNLSSGQTNLRIESKVCEVVNGTFKGKFHGLARAARQYGLRATAVEKFKLVKQGGSGHNFSTSPREFEHYTDLPQSARLAATILTQQMIIAGNTGDDGISISERMTDAEIKHAIQTANDALATVNQMFENPPRSVGCDSRLQNQLYWYRHAIRMTMDDLINNLLIQSSTLEQVQEIAVLAVRAMSTGGNENILTEMTTSIEGLNAQGANKDDLLLLTAVFGLFDLANTIDGR